MSLDLFDSGHRGCYWHAYRNGTALRACGLNKEQEPNTMQNTERDPTVQTHI